MKKIALFLLIGSLGFTACKKKDKETSKADLLVQGNWKLTTANLNGLLDLLTTFEACQKDNYYLFNADKSLSVDEGPTKCTTSAPQRSSDGNWSLSGNDSKITISGSSLTTGLGALSITGDIVTLNATTLQIKKDTAIGTISGTINITFKNIK